MRIYNLFVTRKGQTDVPELVDAWDEWSIEENPDGYNESIAKWRAMPDLDAFAVVAYEVPEQEVLNALYPDPPVVEAKAVDGVNVPE